MNPPIILTNWHEKRSSYIESQKMYESSLLLKNQAKTAFASPSTAVYTKIDPMTKWKHASILLRFTTAYSARGRSGKITSSNHKDTLSYKFPVFRGTGKCHQTAGSGPSQLVEKVKELFER